MELFITINNIFYVWLRVTLLMMISTKYLLYLVVGDIMLSRHLHIFTIFPSRVNIKRFWIIVCHPRHFWPYYSHFSLAPLASFEFCQHYQRPEMLWTGFGGAGTVLGRHYFLYKPWWWARMHNTLKLKQQNDIQVYDSHICLSNYDRSKWPLWKMPFSFVFLSLLLTFLTLSKINFKLNFTLSHNPYLLLYYFWSNKFVCCLSSKIHYLKIAFEEEHFTSVK